MPSVEQLRLEVIRLRKIERDKASLLQKEKKMFMLQKKKQLETRKLEKELRALKSPGATALKRNLRMGGKLIFRALLLAGEDIDRRAKELIKNRRMRIEKERELMKLKAQANLLRLKKARGRKKASSGRRR